MTASLIMRLVAISVGILSTLYLARSGFNFTITEFLRIVLDQFDVWLAFVLRIFGPLISSLLAWLNNWLGLELLLQPHWHHVFALLWLFIGTNARVSGAQLGPAPRVFIWVWAWTCSIVFGVLAGCVPLASPSLALWAAAGYSLFFAIRMPALLLLVVAFAYSAMQFPSTSIIGAAHTSSLGLVLVTVGLAVVGLINLLIGLASTRRDAEASSRQQPNQHLQVGLDILSVLGGAAALLALSEALPSRVQPATQYPRDSVDVGEFRDCDDCPLMKRIPAGRFLMGSDIAKWKRVTGPEHSSWEHGEVPKHAVDIRSFAISVSEVTKDQYAAFVAATKHDSGGFCWGIGAGKSNFDASFNWLDLSP